jgi:hypothetical protein
VYHQCVDCDVVIEGAAALRAGRDVLLEHTAKSHSGETFNLEMYRFLSAIHALDEAYGLVAFQWPDTASRWHWERRVRTGGSAAA